MESIKQEIINNIYENGENLITGPVLQEVLLDMVDDVNDKVASASAAVPGDLVEKTGSWDDAADWVEQNSSSVVLQPDLDGYATEQWVEDQGYLKEVPEGYVTTESLNDLSESVAQSIADIPEPDLSNYVTKPELNEATESVKDWVEAKHYLTTASLSGSVTEETVGFMIGDATASVKEWVEEKNYATETFVSESIAGLDIPSTEGFATTESLNSLSESVANDFANLDIPDVSGLATTESVTQLSESVAASIENLPEPDLSVYATTASVSEATESVKTWVQEQGYLTEHQDISGLATTESLNQVSSSVSSDILNARTEASAGFASVDQGVRALSASFDQRINNITGSDVDLSGYATTESLNQLSESVAQTIENLPQADLSGYLQTSSYLVDSASFDNRIKDAREEATIAITNVSEGVVALSASFDQRINSITGSEADLSGYATTASVNSISQSISQSINTLAGSVADKANARDLTSLSSSVADDFTNLEIPDVSGYATTQSVNTLSASFAETIDNIPGTDLTGYATEQWVQNQGYLTEHQDISGLATTSSVNQLSSSVSSDIQNARTEASQAITGLGTIVQGESDRVTGLSASFDNRINNITGSSADLSGYATTASVNQLSSSVAEDFANLNIPDVSGYATTESVNQLSSSVATDIQNARTEAAAGFDSVNQGVVALSASFDQRINSLDLSEFLFGTGSASGSESIFPSASNWVVEVSQSAAFFLDSELEEGRSIQVIYHNASANSVSVYFNEEYWGPYSVVNGVLGSGSFEIPAGEYGDVVATRIGDRIYFRTSLDVSNIEVDLSEYATTESVNTLSASFAETIDNIPTGSGASGNYLPITGGTLTGDLFVGGNNSIGVGSTKAGIRSLTVGDSATSTTGAHYGLAVGEKCSTDVYGGVALGRETRVNSEPFGVATGFRTRVDKMAGFAGGCLTTASGQFSFAAGFGAVSKGTGQVVLGSFNEIDGTGTGTGSYAVILGNGKSSTWNQDNPGDVVRSNGLAIKWDGGIDINYSGSTITLQDKLAELEQGGGSSVDLSGYATTQSLNVLNSRVTDLSSSFDTRISQIVAASGGLDPADFAGAPTIVYQTDGTTGLVGVNHYTGSEGQVQAPAFDDTAWQLENLDLTNFDRIECYFKNSSTNPATVVTVILDSAAAGPGADTYRGTSWCPRIFLSNTQVYDVEVAVDASKTKLQVPYQFRVDTKNTSYADASNDGNYLYKIVGYPKIV